MFWVVQENLYNEQGQRDLLQALDRRGLPHMEVKFLPFLRRLAPANIDINEIEDVENYPEPVFETGDGHVMVIGAIALARVAAERGWVPGSFINENFHSSKWTRFGLDNLLNSDMEIKPLRVFRDDIYRALELNLRSSPPDLFLRPCNDNKAWTGQVVEGEKLLDFLEARMEEADKSGRFSPDLEIAVSRPKAIHGEFRFFVVDGKLVTGSRYRMGNHVLYNQDIPLDVWGFAQTMVDRFQPARAFVLDVADTLEGPKVIEVNNFNSAGLYACDVGKIVDAVEAMEF